MKKLDQRTIERANPLAPHLREARILAVHALGAVQGGTYPATEYDARPPTEARGR